MNLWVNFDLKFDPILQGKMAKISPKMSLKYPQYDPSNCP